MKFKVIDGELVPVETVDKGNFLMDQYNRFADWAVGKEVELVLKPIGSFLADVSIATWRWFVLNLPDIIGYTAIGTGIFIILSAMTGRGITKPLGWFFGAFIVAVCILGGV